MKKESLGINPAKKKHSKFIDLSNAVYNRHTHDKSMLAEVGEINIMIGIDGISSSYKDREELYRLINSNYGSIFDTKFIDSIRNLSKQDFIGICNYNYKSDTFSGIEFRVLKLLIDYHLEEFQNDMKSGRINKILKLLVSKDETKLIVKVFLNKSTSEYPVLYAQSLLYLVLLHLYQHINRHAYSEWNEYLYNHNLPIDKYVVWVIKSVFTYIVPIITKVVYTISINADDNYTWFAQLNQLFHAYDFIGRSEDENQIMFTFRPKEHYLTSTLYVPVINETPSDTNYSARFIECNYKLDKGNILICKTTILSKDMVDCVFASLIDEDDEPVSIFSNIADKEEIYLAHYSILKRMLSFMKQHETLKTRMNLEAMKYVESGKFKVISDISDKDKIQILTKEKTVEHAFRDINTPTPDDKLLQIIQKELHKLGQKNCHVDYITIILELLQEDRSVIDKILAPLDERISNKIKQIIFNVIRKANKLSPGYTLNEFYKEY